MGPSFVLTLVSLLSARQLGVGPQQIRCRQGCIQRDKGLWIIQHSSNQWMAPLHISLKPGDGCGPCGDFRCLNGGIKADCYLVAHIQEFASQLSGKTIFSKIYLIKGYHQILVHAMDIPLTVVITPFGLF